MGYLKEEGPWFVDVIDERELAIQPEDKDQPITDTEDEKARKRLEHAAKKKAWRNNLCIPVRQALSASSAALLLSRSLISALSSYSLVRALSSCPMPTSSSFSLPTWSSLFVSALLSPLVPALSFFSIPATLSGFVLGLAPTHLTSSAFKNFI